MYRNTRYDAQDYATLGLASGLTTWGYPLTVSGEEIHRNGQRFYIVGHGFHAQTYGAMYSTPTVSDLDTLLDRLAASGVNALSVMEMELYGLVISGTQYGWPAGCFNVGYPYSANKTWAIGDRTTTIDSSGVTLVYRRYVCVYPGSGGSGSTGPTGTGTNITPSGSTARWDYEAPAYTGLNEQFFTGDGHSAGFDRFLDACARRGIYVAIRFDRWDKVFIAANGGYALNGRSGVSAGNLWSHGGLWALDGTSGTVDMAGAMKAHLNVFLDRTNSVNGRRYGDDHTISTFDVLNEQGLPNWYFPANSATSPNANTFDYMCHAGSSVPGGSQSEPNAAVVAWWDAAWLAWYANKYPGHTPNGDYPGKLNTLPCYYYTTLNAGAANNIAQRSTYRAGNSGDGWLLRVAEFLADTEVAFVQSLKNHIRSKSSHILFQAGQMGYVGARAIALGDIVDMHVYPSASATTGNPQIRTSTTAPTAGFAYTAAAGGTLTFTGMSPDASHPLLVGQYVRWTLVSAPDTTGVSPVATNGATWTITGIDAAYPAAGAAIGGTIVNCTVEFPTTDTNSWPFHNATPSNTAATRIHHWMAGSTGEQNADVYWAGQAALGRYATMVDGYHYGKPTTCTELGERGESGPVKGLYRCAYTLLDLLQGGAGAYQFAWNNSTLQTGAQEHGIPGDGGAMLDTILTSLMARYITPFPSYDVAYSQASDYHLFLAKHNSTDGTPSKVTGESFGYYEQGGTDWKALLNRKVRLSIGGVTSPTVRTYTLPDTLWTHPELNNETTGLFFVWYGMGLIGYVSSKLVIMIGRMPTDSVASSLPGSSRLRFSTIDGKAWYGRMAWASIDGSDLGVGRSALFSHAYPREEVQQFRRMFVDTGPTGRVEMLTGDITGFYSGGDANTQPGVVMRNGLRIKLAMTDAAKRARIIERYGVQREQIVSHAGGYMTILPSQPLTLIS